MPYIEYVERKFTPARLERIEQADAICRAYAASGYSLTLRQLYYQFVARGLIENKEREYDNLGTLISHARLAGMIDWEHIVDRTRELEDQPHWGTATDEGDDAAHEFVRSVMPQFRTAKWSSQPTRIEVWVEKAALVDVVARPARRADIPYFACRGYHSQSSAWEAAQRLEGYLDAGAERVVVLHLGDHDPSGIDMTRDIRDRFSVFLDGDGYDPYAVEIRRVALTMDQVREHKPPPNPAKLTDSRIGTYLRDYGAVSWELDALDPPTLDRLITAEVELERNEKLWDEAVAREERGKALLASATERWADVVAMLEDGDGAH